MRPVESPAIPGYACPLCGEPNRCAMEVERATGVTPAFVRSGGTIPILSAFANRGIQAIVSGFATDGDQIHAPNESYRLESIELNEKASRELFLELGKLR